MATFILDLPFYVALDEGGYRLTVASVEVTVEHSVVERADLDPRLGGLAGSFGLERDQLGVLRYSQLALELSQAQLERLGAAFFGDARPGLGPEDHEGKSRVALATCNRFLEQYRVATRAVDVKPLGPSDLALLHFEDGKARGDLRLYGGGITLPPTGLSPGYHERVLARLADPEPPAAYELAAVDALRSIADGQVLESIVTAIGALEAALDLFFTRSWRLREPPVPPRTAGAKVGVRDTSHVYTVEDVLAKAGVWAKVKTYAASHNVDDAERDGLYEAIDLRNLAVHGGVRMPPDKAKPHVDALARFVLDRLAPAICRECPALPRAEFLYACEEALGTECSPKLQRLADAYLTDQGLSGRLFNHRVERRRMDSERFGDIVVMRVSFRDFGPEEITLFIARALLHHALERRGMVATARPADQLPFEEARPFWRLVASELTRAVWGAAIDRRLGELGFGPAIQLDAERRLTELRDYYGASYAPPSFQEFGNWVDYLRLAGTAAVLSPAGRANLLEAIAPVAPAACRRAAEVVQALEAVDFDDPTSIRDTLVQVHDAHESLLATVTIYDPVTRERHGRG